MMRSLTIVFQLLPFLALCIYIANAAPLPRITSISAQDANLMKGYWEYRRAQGTSESRYDLDAAAKLQNWVDEHLYSSVRGRFDPERPYIQLIIPEETLNEYELSQGQGLGLKPYDKYPHIHKTIAILKTGKDNSTAGNNNGTGKDNSTATGNATTNEQSLIDEKAPYLLVQGQGNDHESFPYGAYELAYVGYRPHTRDYAHVAWGYPWVQNVNIHLLNLVMCSWEVPRSSELASPALYNPVYIYKPVLYHPSAFSSEWQGVDALRYVAEKGGKGNIVHHSTNKATAANLVYSESAMPDAKNSVASPVAQDKHETLNKVNEIEKVIINGDKTETKEEDSLEQALNIGKTEPVAVEGKPSVVEEDSLKQTLDIGKTEQVAVEEKSSIGEEDSLKQTLDIGKTDPAAVEEKSSVGKEESLKQALDVGKPEPVTAEEKLSAGKDESSPTQPKWVKKLEGVSDKDLFLMVEGLIQQLHDRLSD